MQQVKSLTESASHESTAVVEELADFIVRHQRLFVLTGAGISHGSGIPTYRDEIGSWRTREPIQHKDFIHSEATRKRYWARSFGGWPSVAGAVPNEAHDALAHLEELGFIHILVTQNVDRLHQKAGHRKVIDLHGRLDQVICMDCGSLLKRENIQVWLRKNNQHLIGTESSLAPDGDADVPDELINRVKIPSCEKCQGLLKPNVVFYGSSVSKELVSYVYEQLDRADGLLVVGTSLMVYSAFRFCRHAHQRGIPIACINLGITRADDMLQLKLNSECGAILQALHRELIHSS